MRSLRHLMVMAVLFCLTAACGDDTTVLTTAAMEMDSNSTGETETTEGPEPTTSDPITTGSTTDGSESTEGPTTGEDSSTSSGTSMPTTEPSSETDTDTDTDTDETSDTGIMEECPDSCPEGSVTRQQVVDDLGMSCQDLFGDQCQQNSINKAEVGKAVYTYLYMLKPGYLEECMGYVPEHPDVPEMSWFYEFISARYCVGLLDSEGQDGQYFCPGAPACHDWWLGILEKINDLP